MEHINNALGTVTVTVFQEDPDILSTVTSARHSNESISEDLMFYGITAEARLDF